jgi:hypothetical protein
VLGVAYLALHLTVTAAVMLWLHRRRPEGFPLIRTALLLARRLAIVGFLVYPTTPPRLAGVDIVDTVSGGHVDLNCGLVSSPYKPYAALPSMHVGYAVIVAAALLRHGRRPSSVRSGRSTRRSWCSSSSPPATTSSSTPPRARSSPGSPPRLRPS